MRRAPRSARTGTESSFLLFLARLRLALVMLLLLSLLPARPAAEVALLHHRAEHVHDRAAAELSGHVGDVVRRRDLDDLHPADALAGDHAQRLQGFAGQKTARLRRARARHEAGVDRVDVERQEDGLRVLPGVLQRDLDRLLDAELL